jgi:protein ImuB
VGQEGFRVHAAIADTLGAAHALAVAGGESLVVAPAHQVSAYLAPLPPVALRLEPPVCQRLEALGLRTVGDLLMLPRASLPARFGPQLMLRLQQALGEVFEGVTPYQPAEVPRVYRPFETPVVDGQAVSMVAGQLLTRLLVQLRWRAAALRQLEGILYYEQAGPRVISIGLARASRAHRHVLELLTQRLEQADLTPGVIGLMLVARDTSRWPGGQGALFESREPGDDEALGCLVDRLAGRLGHAAVMRPRLVDDYQPEMAFRYVSIIRDSHLFSDAEIGDCPYLRPVRLLGRPVPIRVMALVPDGPPTWFWYHGREYVVAHADGPERLETAWWRGPDIRRDYFRVTAESGERFWIFHAPAEHRWYMHGMFG